MHIEDEDENGGEINDEVTVQFVDQEWIRTLRVTNVPLFSVENPGPTNVLHANQRES